MEPNYSKQRLIFRSKSLLLGWWEGCIPPIPPPKSATGHWFRIFCLLLARTENYRWKFKNFSIDLALPEDSSHCLLQKIRRMEDSPHIVSCTKISVILVMNVRWMTADVGRFVTVGSPLPRGESSGKRFCDNLSFCTLHRGIFRGGHWAMAPLWVARIAKLHRKVSKIKTWPPPPPPPPCKLGIRFDYTKGMLRAFLPGFGWKMGRNLSEDLFLFLLLLSS